MGSYYWASLGILHWFRLFPMDAGMCGPYPTPMTASENQKKTKKILTTCWVVFSEVKFPWTLSRGLVNLVSEDGDGCCSVEWRLPLGSSSSTHSWCSVHLLLLGRDPSVFLDNFSSICFQTPGYKSSRQWN